MDSSEEIVSVTLLIPESFKKRITAIARKRLSNFSQVFREAAQIGLETLK